MLSRLNKGKHTHCVFIKNQRSNGKKIQLARFLYISLSFLLHIYNLKLNKLPS